MAKPVIAASNVNVFRIGHVISLGRLSGNSIKNIAMQILQGQITASLFHSFNVNLSFLEGYNIRYTEKQVKRIDENFLDYSQGFRLFLTAPSFTVPRRLAYLVHKFFSGDVSGDIGEALLVYFLVEELGLDPYHICHLRPEKRRRYLTPDFLILDPNNMLKELINEPYNPLLYAEVKSSTGTMTAERIEKGLQQLKRVIGSKHGLLFLMEKKRGHHGYITRVIVVKR